MQPGFIANNSNLSRVGVILWLSKSRGNKDELVIVITTNIKPKSNTQKGELVQIRG